MTTIYLIRHAEAEGNLYRVAQGQHDGNLTDRGWRQVQALERRFTGVFIDAAYSSDLYRTRATATAICRPQGLSLHLRKDLREIHVGDWEQRTWGEIARKTPQAMADFGGRMDRWSIPGAETPAEVLERMLAALADIVRENPGKTVAVFSHGYAIRLVLAKLHGISLRDTGTKSPTGDNTAVSLLEGDEHGLRVIWQTDNSHLQTPEYRAGEKKPVVKRSYALEPGLWFRRLEGEEAPLILEGRREEEPVGLLRLDPDTGHILHIYVRPDCRRRGFGVQLIGQAVLRTRDRGGEHVSIDPPPDSGAREFFLRCGFVPLAEEGRERLTKFIGFDPTV